MSIRLPNSCFIHIPRTGGFWLAEVAQRLGIRYQRLTGDVDSHFTYQQLPDNWRRLPAFGFVRHPLAWIGSRWSHLLEHNLLDDYRHYGVHRLFDQLVKPTFSETLREVIDKSPGLVGRTYSEMLTGANHLYRTEDLPESGFQALALLEHVTSDSFASAIQEMKDKETERPNSTSTIDRWARELGSVSRDLEDEFVASEHLAVEIWNNGMAAVADHPRLEMTRV